MEIPNVTWRIGEIARRSGLSVRTLHYYEEIGLFGPDGRTESGHRVYGPASLLRLQQILSMRSLGFALDDIRACLDEPAFALAPLLELQIERAEAQVVHHQRLVRRLSALKGRLELHDGIPVAQLLETMEAMTMMETFLTPEQREGIVSRREAYKQQHASEFEAAQREAIAALRAHLKAGDAPDHPEVQAVVRRWRALGEVITGGDVGVETALQRMVRAVPEVRERSRLEPALMAYLHAAQLALGVETLARYLTPDQIAVVHERRQAYLAAHGHDVREDQLEVLGQLRERLDAGDQPDAGAVRALATRWTELENETSGGDPAIAASLRRMLAEEEPLRRRLGLDPALFGFLQQALG